LMSAENGLAARFSHLHSQARRPAPQRDTFNVGGRTNRADVAQLKEFYLKRLGNSAPQPRPARAATATTPVSAPASDDRPSLSSLSCSGELEVMCNNCFAVILASQAFEHSQTCVKTEMADSVQGLLDVKLSKLRGQVEQRIRQMGTKIHVMRYLSQLRYHIDTALKWEPNSAEIGALTDHTLQQVKQLTMTSRTIAPAVYVFSKRVENVIVQKEKEVRRSSVGVAEDAAVDLSLVVQRDVEKDCASAVDMNSVVTALDSETGTQMDETAVTEDAMGRHDVADMAQINEDLVLKNEDEQRRWFYAQCLTAKLQHPDKKKVHKVLISDLYEKVKTEMVPIEKWTEWIAKHLLPPEDVETSTAGAHDAKPATLASSLPASIPPRPGAGAAPVVTRPGVIGSGGYPGRYPGIHRPGVPRGGLR